ncbi:Phosphoribulokinase [Marinomonas spartinae]|uniref:Phosphoribulokinase n=1 Tax=Marinomonas spartinae TaxID=1792290 RepID=A0A1A8T7V2_9GAMM|nr:AAA family ATPase [Marinomonas spartinae]SBS28680.1 Phosphoribulokinase [Marinomonas spartinae]
MNKEQLHELYAYSSDVEHALKRMQCAIEKPERTLIGLTGGPGSGKSTLANYLSSRMAEIQPGQMICLSMDGFHYSKKELSLFSNPEEAFSRRGAPWTFNSTAFIERLKRVKHGYQEEDVAWPSFDHQVGDPVENDCLISKDIKLVFVEGLYLLHQEDGWAGSTALFDQHWFLDVPLEIAIERLAQRHMQAWGYTHAQAISRIQNNDGLNAGIVAKSKSKADWIITI